MSLEYPSGERKSAMSQEKPPENVHILERPEARYRIIYERHDRPLSSEMIGHPDILAVEATEMKPQTREAAQQFVESDLGMDIAHMPFFPLKQAWLEQMSHLTTMPVYYIDVADLAGGLEKIGRWGGQFLKILEVPILPAAIMYGVEKGREGIKQKGINRRDFLKLMGAGTAGLWTGTQLLDLASSVFESRAEGHPRYSTWRHAQRSLNEKVHPETEGLAMTLRNAIWAQKLQFLAPELRRKLERKPVIGIKIGAQHSGLEDMLAVNGERRAASIERFLKAFRALGGKNILISSIIHAEFSKEENRWVVQDIKKEPILKNIEEKLWPENTR